jgi:hypothetical protein
MRNLVDGYKHFRGICYPLLKGSPSYPEDGGSRFLRNVSTYLTNYLASHTHTHTHTYTYTEDLNLAMVLSAVNILNLIQLYASHTSAKIQFPQQKMLISAASNTAEFLKGYLPNLSVY